MTQFVHSDFALEAHFSSFALFWLDHLVEERNILVHGLDGWFGSVLVGKAR